MKLTTQKRITYFSIYFLQCNWDHLNLQYGGSFSMNPLKQLVESVKQTHRCIKKFVPGEKCSCHFPVNSTNVCSQHILKFIRQKSTSCLWNLNLLMNLFSLPH